MAMRYLTITPAGLVLPSNWNLCLHANRVIQFANWQFKKLYIDVYTMEVKRAASLIFTLEETGIKVQNFLSKSRFSCNTMGLEFLSYLEEWTPLDTLFEHYSGYERNSLAEQLIRLIDNHAIVVKGTEAAHEDAVFASDWPWGETAGFYHFSIRNSRFMPNAKQRDWIRHRRQTRKEPQAHIPNSDFEKILPLPRMDFSDAVFANMKARRSIRRLKNGAITLQQLADCLYAAKGVTGWVSDTDFGTLPLAMTPSGGARNPYDLYIYAKSVKNLPEGFYHYNGVTHDLALVKKRSLRISDLLAQQDWADTSSAVIFLIADFARSAWKYHLPPAYRVVLMEAGFIGQNIALAATRHNLTAIPTGAVSEKAIENLLGTVPIRQAQILAMVIGIPESAAIGQSCAPQ